MAKPDVSPKSNPTKTAAANNGTSGANRPNPQVQGNKVGQTNPNKKEK